MMAIIGTRAGFPRNDNGLALNGMALRDMALRDMALRDMALRDMALRNMALNDMAQRAAACFDRLFSHRAGNCICRRPAGTAISIADRPGGLRIGGAGLDC